MHHHCPYLKRTLRNLTSSYHNRLCYLHAQPSRHNLNVALSCEDKSIPVVLSDSFFRGAARRRLDPLSDDAPWVSTRNTTIAFGGLPDGAHTLTVRARETEVEGGSSDKVICLIWICLCILFCFPSMSSSRVTPENLHTCLSIRGLVG